MALMNRLANASNQYQGDFKRVLCVCSAGLLRSPTIAWVLSNKPYSCNVRAAGCITEYALVPIDEVLLTWADEIVCAEQKHADIVRDMIEQFVTPDIPIHALNVPDRYSFRAPELVLAIQAALQNIDFKGTMQ